MDAITSRPLRRTSVISNALLGTLIFLFTEAMLFAGMISALTITRANQLPGNWPPPGQPRLPFEETRINTVALILSGAMLLASNWKSGRPRRALIWTAFVLGAAFVVLQGREWFALIAQGLTMRSSTIGSFFYLIVGTHGLHAIIALGLLAALGLQKIRTQGLNVVAHGLWYFVVLAWPVIYVVVYL